MLYFGATFLQIFNLPVLFAGGLQLMFFYDEGDNLQIDNLQIMNRQLAINKLITSLQLSNCLHLEVLLSGFQIFLFLISV